MNKHKYFVKFLKKINLSINSLLEKYLNKLNVNNLSNITSSNKFLLIFVVLFIFSLSYLSIPHVYNKAEIRKELESQFIDKFGLNLIVSENFKYKFFPRPNFIVEDSLILENEFEVANIKKLRIFVSLKSLFSLRSLTIKDVVLENTNFNLNKKNSNFFIKILDNEFLNSSFVVKDSNIFFQNIDREVLFINKINKIKYYYDSKELKNILSSENEIFNIPYLLTLHKNNEEKKVFLKINVNFLKLQIENEFIYDSNKKKGLINIVYNKNKSKGAYHLKENIFVFNYFDKLIEPDFTYEGRINLKPFFADFNGKTDKLDLFALFNSDFIIVQLLKAQILNNKNLNINFSIDANKIKKYQNFVNFSLNSKIQEGLIDIDKTKFSWLNYVNFHILDSLLYVNNNQLILDGKLIANVKDDDKIYKYLQISKNLRPELETIEFNFNYNFDQQIMNFNNIKINDEISKKLDDILKKIILKNDKLQNKVYLKNIMKEAISLYAG